MKCKRKGCLNLAGKNPYKGHEPLYCSKKCKNIDHVDIYRKKSKQILVDLLGGKCVRCGYNKCLAALEFHHKDPKKKKFSITRSITLNSEKVVEEVKKCLLVCANCHREIHQGE